eukprot:scaffold131558_cov57-Phaeocystis_antarctica.AAC.1
MASAVRPSLSVVGSSDSIASGLLDAQPMLLLCLGWLSATQRTRDASGAWCHWKGELKGEPKEADGTTQMTATRRSAAVREVIEKELSANSNNNCNGHLEVPFGGELVQITSGPGLMTETCLRLQHPGGDRKGTLRREHFSLGSIPSQTCTPPRRGELKGKPSKEADGTAGMTATGRSTWLCSSPRGDREGTLFQQQQQL